MELRKLLFNILTLVVFAGFAYQTVQADPLTFSNVVALQNQGITQVGLVSQPGVTLIGPNISFLVDINGVVPPAPSQTLLVTFTEEGRAPVTQTFQLIQGLPNPFSLLFSVTALGANSQGVNATLLIDILGSDPDFINPHTNQGENSHTYSFKVTQPIPEPTSMVLMSVGVVGLIEKRRRSRRWLSKS